MQNDDVTTAEATVQNGFVKTTKNTTNLLLEELHRSSGHDESTQCSRWNATITKDADPLEWLREMIYAESNQCVAWRRLSSEYATGRCRLLLGFISCLALTVTWVPAPMVIIEMSGDDRAQSPNQLLNGRDDFRATEMYP